MMSAVLNEAPSVRHVIFSTGPFLLEYLLLTCLNYRLTGKWMYPFLDDAAKKNGMIGLLCVFIGLFCVSVRLFCVSIGLSCVCVGLFCVSKWMCPFHGDAAKAGCFLGLFCVSIGLFGMSIRLFGVSIGLFCVSVGLFCVSLGLFSVSQGLFCMSIGLFGCVYRAF